MATKDAPSVSGVDLASFPRPQEMSREERQQYNAKKKKRQKANKRAREEAAAYEAKMEGEQALLHSLDLGFGLQGRQTLLLEVPAKAMTRYAVYLDAHESVARVLGVSPRSSGWLVWVELAKGWLVLDAVRALSKRPGFFHSLLSVRALTHSAASVEGVASHKGFGEALAAVRSTIDCDRPIKLRLISADKALLREAIATLGSLFEAAAAAGGGGANAPQLSTAEYDCALTLQRVGPQVLFGVVPREVFLALRNNVDHTRMGATHVAEGSLHDQMHERRKKDGRVTDDLGQTCRATHKIAEALDAARQVLGFDMPADAAAVDVGAAPGGWTRVLATHCSGGVTAIDPADMSPDVLAMPNVTHMQMVAEKAVALMKAEAEESRNKDEQQQQGRRFDVLSCDVNFSFEGSELSKMLEPLFPLMKAGALMVLTLKLNFQTEQRGGSGRPGFRAWQNHGVGEPMANSAERELVASKEMADRDKPREARCAARAFREANPVRVHNELKLQKSVAALFEQLDADWKEPSCHWLFWNTAYERTVLALRK